MLLDLLSDAQERKLKDPTKSAEAAAVDIHAKSISGNDPASSPLAPAFPVDYYVMTLLRAGGADC